MVRGRSEAVAPPPVKRGGGRTLTTGRTLVLGFALVGRRDVRHRPVLLHGKRTAVVALPRARHAHRAGGGSQHRPTREERPRGAVHHLPATSDEMTAPAHNSLFASLRLPSARHAGPAWRRLKKLGWSTQTRLPSLEGRGRAGTQIPERTCLPCPAGLRTRQNRSNQRSFEHQRSPSRPAAPDSPQ